MRFSRRRVRPLHDSSRSFGQLLERAKCGDDDAVADLYLEHVAMVRGYLRACGLRDPDDVASEVFIGMLRGLNRFSGDHPAFRRWLMTIAHRRLVDQRRRWLRNRSDLTEPETLEQTSAPTQVTDLSAIEVDPELIEAFEALTEPQREVLALRFVADASLQDVASITGRPIPAVKSLQSRGLEALRRRLAHSPSQQGAAP